MRIKKLLLSLLIGASLDGNLFLPLASKKRRDPLRNLS